MKNRSKVFQTKRRQNKLNISREQKQTLQTKIRQNKLNKAQKTRHYKTK